MRNVNDRMFLYFRFDICADTVMTAKTFTIEADNTMFENTDATRLILAIIHFHLVSPPIRLTNFHMLYFGHSLYETVNGGSF